MRVSVLQDNLYKGLSIVGRAVESRPTLPILANVMLSTEDARLRLSAANMSTGLGISVWIGAKVEDDGAVTIPARTLQDLVATLPAERVDMDLDVRTLTLHLRCAGKTANIKGMDATDFPDVPLFDAERAISVPAVTFKEMIDQVVFCAAKEDNRPILTGILMRFEGDVLTLASADGYRLSVRTTELEMNVGDHEPLIVPARTLSELSRIITDEDEEVLIALPDGRGQVMFSLKSVVIVSQLIEGKFPDYEAIIPRRYETSVLAYTSDLLAACKSSEVFAKDSANTARLVVQPGDNPNIPGQVVVAGKSQEKGDAEAPLEATVEGQAVEIAFNIRYLIDVLNVIREDQVVLETSGPTSPGVVRPSGRDDFIHVIMPMSTGR